MVTVSVVLLAFWAVGVALTLWGTWLSVKRLHSSVIASQETIPISILKPVKGIDSGLRCNLESFFKLDYPKYEMLLCVASEYDAAVPVIHELLEQYPGIDAKLLIGEEDIGVNPKINTISRAYRVALYDHILISDSNVRAPAHYLSEVSRSLDEKTGIATAVVAGTEPSDMGGVLESTYLNTFYARWMNLAAWFGFPAVVGKCMFFRRTVLERVGGVKTFGRYIAEDYMAGQAMELLGLKVGVMCVPVCQHIGDYSFKAYWQRHIRWGRIRKAQAPLAFIAEPLFFSVVSGLFGALSMNALIGLPFLSTFILHMGIWALLDLLLIRRLDAIRWNIFVAWILREFLAVPLWAHALLGNSVSWRGSKYQISFGGLVSAS